MNRSKEPPLIEHFNAIEDPRLLRRQQHRLEDIFFIALCAVICGCDSWVAIEKFTHMKRAWFEQYLELENGIPSHDTFGRVFALIDPTQFHRCFSNWVQAVAKHVGGDVIAIDGKCLRGSYDKGDEKSNEITALPALLTRLDITGAVITADALYTQKQTAELIVKQGGHCVLALKGNQGTLRGDVSPFFLTGFNNGMIFLIWAVLSK